MRLEVFYRLPYHCGLIYWGKPVISALSFAIGSRLNKLGLALALGGLMAVGAQGIQARGIPSDLGTVAPAELPAEARQTQERILQGGPFPYAKDGSVFGNRERLLPREKRGYYREYTVKTPGSRDRGARRIVCGGEKPAAPRACYYTADHYASFKRIAQ
jgi:ribonuclease T1